jgi:hypothetical protein
MKLFDFKYTRQSIGIFLVFMGSPLIFFFKETLGFGGSSAFTVAGFCSGFVFMVSTDTFRKFYKLNTPIFRLGLIFTLISLIYFYAYNEFIQIVILWGEILPTISCCIFLYVSICFE